ncbi:MAG TPA: pitrilysin family protein [Polyangia bacterium]|nr:pitrilysin family protein [Polyangia bacterium]
MSRALATFLLLASLPSWSLPALAADKPGAIAKPDLTKAPELPPAPSWTAPVPSSCATSTTFNLVSLPQHELPIAHVLVTVAAGSALDPSNRPGLAAAVASMLEDGGAAKRSSSEVAQAFAALGTELEEHVDSDQVQLTMTVLARNLEPAIALLKDLVEAPRFDPADWQRTQARRLDEIRRRLDQPEHVADDVFAQVLYGDHPYGHPFIGTVDSVRAITVDELRAFWRQRYSPSNVTFIVVGDVDDGALRRRFGFCRPAPRTSLPTTPPAPRPLPPRVVLVDRPGATQSEIRVGNLGFARSTPDFAALTLLETVLGGSFTSRLNLNLREKHGYTYGARAQFDLRSVAGPFVAAAGVRTDATAAALKETVAEIAGMRAPLSPAELQKGRALVMHSIVEAFADGNETANYLADLAAHHLPLDDWSKLPAALAALDVAATTRVAGYAFRPDALTIVVVGDRKLVEPSLRQLPFVKSLEILTP